MRSPVAAVLAGLLLAAVGAVILGEYELVGFRPVVAGILFGAAIGETVATVGRRADVHMLAAASLTSECGLVWALWISTGHRPSLASGAAWIGVVVGTAAAPLWLKSAGQRGAHTQDAPSQVPDA